MAEPALSAKRAKAKPKPFQFYTALALQESTGLRASTLPTLAKLLWTVPESCVYYHTHHFLLQHQYLTPEPTHDFAYWVAEVLGEERLGEELASIDTIQYASLQGIREAIAGAIDAYLKQHPAARFRFVSEGGEFFFMKSVHVIMPLSLTASTLAEFAQHLEQVSVRSLYFHIFDARLRLGKPTNDFAMWVTEQLGLEALGESLSQLDPYAHTLETLRSIILSLVQEELDRPVPADA
jgi:hypothetical protein